MRSADNVVAVILITLLVTQTHFRLAPLRQRAITPIKHSTAISTLTFTPTVSISTPHPRPSIRRSGLAERRAGRCGELPLRGWPFELPAPAAGRALLAALPPPIPGSRIWNPPAAGVAPGTRAMRENGRTAARSATAWRVSPLALSPLISMISAPCGNPSRSACEPASTLEMMTSSLPTASTGRLVSNARDAKNIPIGPGSKVTRISCPG